jgi:eukaryotic-like serine/threonine-protein kinase
MLCSPRLRATRMSSTVSHVPTSPIDAPRAPDGGLLARYRALTEAESLPRATPYRKLRLLGTGGQGAVYLARREGSDGFSRAVALKVFSPEPYRDAADYDEDMGRVGRVAARVALIQHDNVLDIHDFFERDGLRLMEMEWLDGHDLRQVLSPAMLQLTRARVSPADWARINDVIITAGPTQPRLKPGVAIQVLRDCLAALAALHREGIAHGDIKPSNVLLKRAGNAKLIDIGPAVDLDSPSARRLWSPAYAAPEVLDGGTSTPLSDLASLGYVLVEMLAGRDLFEGLDTRRKLLEAKRALEGRLPDVLPPDVSGNELLLDLCRRLVAADPARRFPGAQAADLGSRGAAAFHRQLVKGDLASEYDNDIRVWLAPLG